jgi:ATP-dependent exoDNAse (exonuclease V) alpha subunit
VIPRIIFEHTMPRTGIKLRRRQFPLRLCYSTTYNKSQGQTLDHVLLDLRNPPFAHGSM